MAIEGDAGDKYFEGLHNLVIFSTINDSRGVMPFTYVNKCYMSERIVLSVPSLSETMNFHRADRIDARRL